MDVSDIWTKIVLPILIGPLFIYLKSVYDNYQKKKIENKLMIYNHKQEHLSNILTKFYWPLYIKLLCIYQLNFNIPIKNNYEYISESENEDDESEDNKSDDSNNSDIHININVDTIKETTIGNIKDLPVKDIILDHDTIKLMNENLGELFKESLDIIENNIYHINISKKIDKNIVQFIKYCKIRKIINNKYNLEYLGVKNNTNELLSLIELEVYKYQNEYNNLMQKGPYNL